MWLELEERDENVAQLHCLMDQMRCTAFQKEASKHEFPLHMTLLYNFDLIAPNDDCLSEEEAAHRLLIHCSKRIRETAPAATDVQLQPKEWFTLDYPKSADNGKGFGAAVSLLIVEKDLALQQLHETVRSVFPDDERQNHNFTPHLSLVYAPQQSLQTLKTVTDRLQEEEYLLNGAPLRAKNLSVWSTRGPTCEWYRVSTISLGSPAD